LDPVVGMWGWWGGSFPLPPLCRGRVAPAPPPPPLPPPGPFLFPLPGPGACRDLWRARSPLPLPPCLAPASLLGPWMLRGPLLSLPLCSAGAQLAPLALLHSLSHLISSVPLSLSCGFVPRLGPVTCRGGSHCCVRRLVGRLRPSVCPVVVAIGRVGSPSPSLQPLGASVARCFWPGGVRPVRRGVVSGRGSRLCCRWWWWWWWRFIDTCTKDTRPRAWGSAGADGYVTLSLLPDPSGDYGVVKAAPCSSRVTQVRSARTPDRPMRFACAAAYQ